MAAIGDIVEKGSVLAYTGGEPVYAQIDGVIRGMLQAGVPVKKGMKIGDVDPRKDESLVHLISDKSHKIGRGCAEAVRTLVGRQYGIVALAAGLSSRYGGNKLLEEQVDGRPLYEVTLDKLGAFSDCTRVIVTRFPEIAGAAGERGVRAVINREPERGISHSCSLDLRNVFGRIRICGAYCVWSATSPIWNRRPWKDFWRRAFLIPGLSSAPDTGSGGAIRFSGTEAIFRSFWS